MSDGNLERFEPEIVTRARRHAGRAALIDGSGARSYDWLLDASKGVSAALRAGRTDLDDERVAFLASPGAPHVAVQWGVWRAGGIAVPLAVSHPPPELAYVLDDARPSAVLVEPALAERIEPLARDRGIRLLSTTDIVQGTGATTEEASAVDESGREPPDVDEPPEPLGAPSRRALMIYTSGTTGRPKGVVTTHGNVVAQIRTLVEAWGWSPDDRILHVLPLHHVHGVINVLSCALWSGACCEFLSPFSAQGVWERLSSGEISVFMAVPTIYGRLIRAWEESTRDDRERWSAGAKSLRLMVSGSAALPVSTLQRWEEITGQRLLERYGMTEIGMGLSNPLDGERRAGTVGQPLPGVDARVVDADGEAVAEGEPGEIEIRGPQVFREYWGRPEETAASFHDGWFRTGDEAVVDDGYFRILGRQSVDIIKTGGYKVSALEIEEVLRGHEAIDDVAVTGVPDPDWGERVCAAIVPTKGEGPPLAELRDWCKERLAPYKAPRQLLVVEDLPRNAMGKVVKPDVQALLVRAADAERG